MDFFKIIEKGYNIYILGNDSYLKIYVKNANKKEKYETSFKPLRINFKDYFTDYFSNFDDLIQKIKNKNIIATLEEKFDINKTYIKYLNFKLLKNVSNETNEIISKKIYVLNIEYYLTESFNHKRINSHPFISLITKDYFNLEDIIDLINEEDLLQIYNIDEYKYFNNELGCFIDIKDENIEIKEKLILEFHISERKDIIKYNLNQTKIYLEEEFRKIKNRNHYILDFAIKYDLVFLYASPIIKNEYYEESDAPISYMDEIRKIIKLMNNNKKKLNLKFECANDKNFADILRYNRTKILHISAHGLYNGKYSLVLENLEKNGQILLLNMEKLNSILNLNKNYISQMDLVIVSTCYSEDLGLLFKECGAKNIIYIDKNTQINDRISVLFTKYFYKNLFEGKTIKQSFDNAKNEMESNEEIKAINFKSCCCNHYHVQDCLSHQYNFHKKHDKKKENIECHCKNNQQPNFHNKDCLYYNDFIKYLDEKRINKNKIKIIEEENINKICCCDLNIEHNEIKKIKYDSRLKEYENIKLLKYNNKGKTFINSNISFYYDEKKYKSIIGRKGLMGKIFFDLTNQNKYSILFGEKNLGKINFIESLCVFLYERKKIKSYEIYRIYSENDYKYMEYKLNEKYKYNDIYLNKNVIVIKFDNDNDIFNYQFFYQIIIY